MFRFGMVKLKSQYKGILNPNRQRTNAAPSGRPRHNLSCRRPRSKHRRTSRTPQLNVDISLYYQLAFDKSQSMDDYIEALYATGILKPWSPNTRVGPDDPE